MCACDCVCVCACVCVCVYQYYSLHDPTIAGRCAIFVGDTRVELVPVARITSVSATPLAQTPPIFIKPRAPQTGSKLFSREADVLVLWPIDSRLRSEMTLARTVGFVRGLQTASPTHRVNN